MSEPRFVRKLSSADSGKGSHSTNSPDETGAKVSRLATITSISAFVAVGCLAFAVVTHNQASSAMASVQADLTTAVVAAQSIPSGTTVEESMLTTAQIPSRYLGEGTLQDLSDAVGKQAVVRIDANTPVRGSELTGSDASSSLAGRIAKGMKAVSIDVSTETDFAQSLLHQGDRVSLYRFDSEGKKELVTSDVEVLALDGYVSYQDLVGASTAASYSTVSVQVTQQKAEEIRALQDQGTTLWMVLSSSADTKR